MEKPQRLRTELATNVFEEAIDRMVKVYEEGHRVVVSFSGGKDSGTCVEICVIAATLTGRLPVEVVMRDEEIMFPGTFTDEERVMANKVKDLYRLILMFEGDEAAIVREAVGDSPAVSILEMCKTKLGK